MTRMLSSFRRLYLCVAVIFAAGTACAIAGQTTWLFWVAFGISVLQVIAQRQQPKQNTLSHWRSFIVLLLTLFISFGYVKWRLASTAPEPLLKYAGRSAIIVGKLLEKLPSRSPDCDNYSLLIEKMVFPQNQVLKLKTQITIHRDSRPPEGTQELTLKKRRLFRVAVRGQLNDEKGEFKSLEAASHSPGNPRTTRVFLTCATRDITEYDTALNMGTETTWQRISSAVETGVEATRSAIVGAHIVALSNERGCLLASMVLGDKAIKLPDQVIRNFRMIGLSHILAASGFNLTLVITMSFFVSASILQTERQRALFTLCILICFVLLAGLSASIVRAAIMCFILVISRLSRRKSQITATIATALLITLVIDPHALLDLGLQLSYVATLGITCGAQPLSELLQMSPSRAGRCIAEVTSSCLMAQLSVLPLQVLSFWNANVLFLLANIMVLPLVGPITIVGFASSIIAIGSIVCPATKLVTQMGCNAIDSIIAIPLNYILWTSNYLTTFRWAHLRLGKPDIAQVIFYYVCYVIFIIAMRRQWHRALVFALPICALAGLMLRSPSADMTVGALRASLVIVNGQKDAAILPMDRIISDDQTIDRFLNFAAVRDSITLKTSNQSLGSIKLEMVAGACSIYLDSTERLGAVYVSSPCKLKLALDYCGDVLGKLHESEDRLLIIRMDSELTSTSQLETETKAKTQAKTQTRIKPKEKPEQICANIAKVMQSCGLETAILIFNNHQYQRFAPLFKNVCSNSISQKHAIAVLADKSLTVITLSRKQLGAHF